MKMDTTSNISKFFIIFNYMFNFGLQEHVFIKVRKMYLPGAGEERGRCVLGGSNKGVFLEVENEKWLLNMMSTWMYCLGPFM